MPPNCNDSRQQRVATAADGSTNAASPPIGLSGVADKMVPGAGTIDHPLRFEADVLAGAATARSTGHGRLNSADRDDADDVSEAGVPGYDYYEEDGERYTIDPCPTCGKMIPTHLMPLHDDSCCPSKVSDSNIEEESDTDDGGIVEVVCTDSTGAKLTTHLPTAEVSHLRAQAG